MTFSVPLPSWFVFFFIKPFVGDVFGAVTVVVCLFLLNLLFGDVFGAVAVVVYLSSLIERDFVVQGDSVSWPHSVCCIFCRCGKLF